MMRRIEIYKPYSILVVPFPFTDNTSAKKRPALVLSSEEHQKQTDHITLLMITSAKHSAWATDNSIIHLETTGLSATSIVRQKIFRIDQRLVLEKIGNLSMDDQKSVMDRLNKHLTLKQYTPL